MSLYPINKQWSDFSTARYNLSKDFPFFIQLTYLTRFPAHRHDFLELSLVLSGEGYQIINNRIYSMKPGTLMFLLPHQVQDMYATSGKRIQLYNCIFDMQFLTYPSGLGGGLEKLLTDNDDLPPSIELQASELEKFTQLFEEINDEYNGSSLWRTQFIRSKLWELLIFFDRIRNQQHPAPYRQAGSTDASFWRIVRYILLHYREPLTLTDLANLFSISHTNLSGQFKKYVGQNYIHFLQEIRIRHACSLLVSTEMNLLDISTEVGFGSSRSFLRAFQRLKGVTPKEYRDQYYLRENKQV